MFVRLFILSILFALVAEMTFADPPRADLPFVGVDANYSLDLEKSGQVWTSDGQSVDLFKHFAKQGAQGFRVRLWMSEEGNHGKQYASEVVRQSLAAGLEPYLVIFLSEDWADLMKQPMPSVWKDLSLEDRCEAVTEYSRESVKHFRSIGLRSHLYEIGNEIDYGICGVYPGKSTKKNPESLSKRCWPEAAKLISASQKGVREADPEAKFLLHISHWWDTEFCIAFFQYMVNQGVELDYTGLSYFPSSNIGGSIELEQFERTIDALHKALRRPLIIPESAYPSTREFKGQFATWRKETPGYPLSPEGQQQWYSDFLDFCAHKEYIASVYYWSPEWSGDTMWTGFALFDKEHQARPGWSAFSTARQNRPAWKRPVYYEIRNNKLYAIPLQEARVQATEKLKDAFGKFGKVNVDYIQAISNESLVVDGYSVSLRASLSGNIDLTSVEDESKAIEPKVLLSNANESNRIVVFVDDSEGPLATALAEEAQAKGVELLVHPWDSEKPLKFGLDISWQKQQEFE